MSESTFGALAIVLWTGGTIGAGYAWLGWKSMRGRRRTGGSRR